MDTLKQPKPKFAQTIELILRNHIFTQCIYDLNGLGYMLETRNTPQQKIIISDYSKIFMTESTRKYFLHKLLKMPKGKAYVKLSELVFHNINELFTLMLDSMSPDNNDSEEFLLVLQCVLRFYRLNEEGRKEFISSELSVHEFFSQKMRWEALFFFLGTEKYNDFVNKKVQENKEKRSNTIFKKLFWTNYSTENKIVSEDKKNIKKNLDNVHIYTLALKEINYYLIHLNVDMELAANWIITFGKRAQIGNKIIKDFLSQLEDTERRLSTSTNYSSANIFGIIKLPKNLTKTFYIKLALPYLTIKDTPTRLLSVCKEWKEKLQKPIYEFYLIQNHMLMNDRIRINIWKNIFFNVKGVKDVSYQKYLDMIKTKKLDKRIENVIQQDINRSLRNHKDFDYNKLHNLLRCYAYYNPETSYCQGMNYIVGFLLLNFKDEELTFKCFLALMENYLNDLFDQGFTKLKMLFYQYNKLLKSTLPNLAQHFQRERIDPNCFAASWFLTLFTNAFQHTTYSYTLLKIWDIFLLVLSPLQYYQFRQQGWKGLLKVTLYILKIHEQQFLNLKFEEIMNVLMDVTKTELFTTKDYGLMMSEKGQSPLVQLNGDLGQVQNFTKNVDEMPISDRQLEKLQRQFELFTIKVQSLFKKYST